ncbi:glutamate--tRNA ligase [Candidatus Roizmanbacteria bacterium RIFCSPLOWO2_02_FULL_38_10]|uniref:Glutamate--tRNA ligase n=1 Tax=Candidatus Roizmanbacteria bacterium RIFCSPLOWO2_02_FULL_38_10 TaxID=1802074 RepID=A0A1F7JND1_9BACT|nr:MAG: glutamate--tRNA ligase [Candidatus Roizmanbacteria bacterium RIFCSPLOWO2_02_FULL_38_10]
MVRTRIAPSPTGEDLHIGNLYTALINWVVAKKNNGKFIVRIEDTDRSRLIKGSEDRILSTLKSFGLNPDESPLKMADFGPYRQSERLEIYKKYVDLLIEKGAAYRCFCSKERLVELRNKQQAEKKVPKYDKHCLRQVTSNKSYVIRLNVPENKEIVFEDIIRGEIKFNSNDIDDQVLIKSDGYPTYHLAVVIDDYLMKISHVIRAEEWISSTPKHILIYEALGWEKPIFAHLPILRNPDKSKLSKRKNPVWASWYLNEGYLPEAILNYLSLMGWSHPEQNEIFSLDEFVKVFELKDVLSVGPVFDVRKLEWMNGEYIRAMEIRQLEDSIFNFHKGKYSKELIKKTSPLVQERIKTLKEYDEYCEFFIQKPTKYDVNLTNYQNMLSVVSRQLSAVSEADWHADKIGKVMQLVATELKMKNSEFFMILRVAITGKKISPPLNDSMEILGKEECLERIKSIIKD